MAIVAQQMISALSYLSTIQRQVTPYREKCLSTRECQSNSVPFSCSHPCLFSVRIKQLGIKRYNGSVFIQLVKIYWTEHDKWTSWTKKGQTGWKQSLNYSVSFSTLLLMKRSVLWSGWQKNRKQAVKRMASWFRTQRSLNYQWSHIWI